MHTIAILFWCCIGVVAYTFLVYPALLALLAAWRKRALPVEGTYPASVSVVVAAHNEQARIGDRVRDLLAQLQAPGIEGEVIVVSDGSTDGTAEVVRGLDGAVRLIELTPNVGKAAALNRGVEVARGEILAFADARQRWAPGTLKRLVDDFADPAIGAVSGDLVIEAAPGVIAGLGLYWRYEKAIRRLSSRVGSSVGVTGAVCAVRRVLFQPIPPGLILDDVYWPMRVVMQGYRVVHDERALAFDRLPTRAKDEFRRKVRTLGGNFQLVANLPALLVPWKNPIWWQFVSHKLSRLLMPWALIGALVTAAALLPRPIYCAALALQLVGYAIALMGLSQAGGRRSRLAAAAASFLVLNAAAWLSFWVWLFGGSSRSWHKVRYEDPKPTATSDANAAC